MVASPAPPPTRSFPTEDDDARTDDLTMALETRIMQMKRLGSAMAPGSPAEALKVLRDAFPETSLSERVAALTGADAAETR